MKQSVIFSDSIHTMIYLATVTDVNLLKSEAIAVSIMTNASNVRKILGNLKRAGLITSSQGKANPKIAKPLDEISLLDIFNSLQGENKLLSVDTKTNSICVVGANIQDTLNETYNKIQKIAEEEMSKIKLSDLVEDLQKRAKINKISQI